MTDLPSVRIVRVESTPNPRAMKFFLSSQICTESRSYRPKALASPTDQRQQDQSPPAHATLVDALAYAVFTVPGVTSLLVHQDWMTVNIADAGQWKVSKAGLDKALASMR